MDSSINNIPDSKGANAYHRDKSFSKLLEFYSGKDMLSKIESQFKELGEISEYPICFTFPSFTNPFNVSVTSSIGTV